MYLLSSNALLGLFTRNLCIPTYIIKFNSVIAKINHDPYVSYHNVSKELYSHKQTLSKDLKWAGYKKKPDIGMAHKLTQK